MSEASKIKRDRIWKNITEKINSLGIDLRSIEEVKNKWKNLCSSAKQTYNDLKRERSKTGGGRAPKPINEETDHIISLFEGKPAFEGLNGFSSFQFTNEGIYQLTKYEISFVLYFHQIRFYKHHLQK